MNSLALIPASAQVYEPIELWPSLNDPLFPDEELPDDSLGDLYFQSQSGLDYIGQTIDVNGKPLTCFGFTDMGEGLVLLCDDGTPMSRLILVAEGIL